MLPAVWMVLQSCVPPAETNEFDSFQILEKEIKSLTLKKRLLQNQPEAFYLHHHHPLLWSTPLLHCRCHRSLISSFSSLRPENNQAKHLKRIWKQKAICPPCLKAEHIKGEGQRGLDSPLHFQTACACSSPSLYYISSPFWPDGAADRETLEGHLTCRCPQGAERDWPAPPLCQYWGQKPKAKR